MTITLACKDEPHLQVGWTIELNGVRGRLYKVTGKQRIVLDSAALIEYTSLTLEPLEEVK